MQQVTTAVEWHGTEAEALALLTALNHNCECVIDPIWHALIEQCSAHALLTDQAALNRLLYVRRTTIPYVRKEFNA